MLRGEERVRPWVVWLTQLEITFVRCSDGSATTILTLYIYARVTR